MPQSEAFVHLASNGLGVPVVDPCEDPEDGTSDEDIVEMSDHEVRVMEVTVHASNREEHPRDAAQGEGDQEPDRPEGVRLEHQGPAPKGSRAN